MKSFATISACGLYRYALIRQWAKGPTALFIMLNPSTADAHRDDPTIRRCLGFAKREHCGALRVENLFARRSTAPRDVQWRVKTNPESAIGEADAYLIEALATHDGPLIVAWGAFSWARPRAQAVLALIQGQGKKPFCLGVTNNNDPKHPLFLSSDTPLQVYG